MFYLYDWFATFSRFKMNRTRNWLSIKFLSARLGSWCGPRNRFDGHSSSFRKALFIYFITILHDKIYDQILSVVMCQYLSNVELFKVYFKESKVFLRLLNSTVSFAFRQQVLLKKYIKLVEKVLLFWMFLRCST